MRHQRVDAGEFRYPPVEDRAVPAEHPDDERPRAAGPRERALMRGVSRLSATDLLTLALGGAGDARRSRLSRTLIRRHGVERLARLTPEEWRRERGIGPAAAARMSAVFELGRRVWAERREERATLATPRQAFGHVKRLARARKEHLVGLYLDAQNGLLHQETISIGSLNTTRSHPREILYPAIRHLALGFILAHNHPSGCLEPSGEDVQFTQAIRRAGELMGIELYDHLIVAAGGYTSLKERGIL